MKREGIEELTAERLRAEERARHNQKLEAMRDDLDRIANPACGCRPRCRCLEPGALEIYRQEAREIAGRLLKSLPEAATDKREEANG